MKNQIMENFNFSNSTYLKGQFLIATPLLLGSCFEKSVVYLCDHNENGAMGLLINRSIGRVKSSDFFNKIKSNNIFDDIIVHFGGPVELTRGFVLHSSDYSNNNTVSIREDISMTADVNVLKDITSGSGPDKKIVAFGYAGWEAGQLEEEVLSNAWINCPANNEVIFEIENANKWQAAANIVGVDLAHYSNAAGHA